MTIPEVIDELYHQAHKAAKIPRRDKREPGRLEKEAAEARIYALTRRVFRRQQARVVAWLESEYPGRKAVDVYDAWAEWDEDETDDLIAELQRAVKNGVKLFASSLPGAFDLDFALINKRALAKAREYTYELVKGITATTRDTLQRVISAFVETPGMTIGDVVRSLPYSEERALRVAVTEITRAYSTAAQDAAADLKEKYPDVMVTKTWFTNNDDIVCVDICEPLNTVEIEQDQQFDGGYDGPPAHVNCRCWLGHRTRIGGEIPGREQAEPVPAQEIEHPEPSMDELSNSIKENIGIEPTIQSVVTLPSDEFNRVMRDDYKQLFVENIGALNDEGKIIFREGYEDSMLHELLHSAGFAPSDWTSDGIAPNINDGLTQSATEFLAEKLGITVRSGYDQETSWAEKYIINTTGLDKAEFYKQYAAAEEKQSFLANTIWNMYGDKFSDPGECGENIEQRFLKSVGTYGGYDQYLYYLVDELGVGVKSRPTPTRNSKMVEEKTINGRMVRILLIAPREGE